MSRELRVAIAVVAVGAFLGVLTQLTVSAARSVPRLSDQRADAVASPTVGLDGALWPVGGGATVLKDLRSMLQPGERYWLSVKNPDADLTSYQLVSEYYLYPAIAVSHEADADVLLVVGGDPGERPAGYTTLIDKDGIWVGRRA